MIQTQSVFNEVARVWLFQSPEIQRRFYDWAIWEEIFPHLDKLILLSGYDAAIRTEQFLPTEDKPAGKSLPFGRMKWNYKNNEKWACKYLRDPTCKDNVRFLELQVWAPSWTACEKEDIYPRVYFHLQNIREDVPSVFKLAVDRALYNQLSIEIDKTVADIAEILSGGYYKAFDLKWNGAPLIKGGKWTNGPIWEFPAHLWRSIGTDTAKN